MNKYQKFISALLNNASLVFFIIVLLLFGSLSSKFLTLSNLLNIVTQGSSTAILAIGMTFVLLFPWAQSCLSAPLSLGS
jgi:ribose/xylose/arabinose/galactoside ABC-type transport system permease subunit